MSRVDRADAEPRQGSDPRNGAPAIFREELDAEGSRCLAEFTGINIQLTILRKKIEDLHEAGAPLVNPPP